MSDLYKNLLIEAQAFEIVKDFDSSNPDYKEKVEQAAVAVVQNYRKKQVKYPVTTLKKQLVEEYIEKGKKHKIIVCTINFLEEVEILSRGAAKGTQDYKKYAIRRLRKIGLA